MTHLLWLPTTVFDRFPGMIADEAQAVVLEARAEVDAWAAQPRFVQDDSRWFVQVCEERAEILEAYAARLRDIAKVRQDHARLVAKQAKEEAPEPQAVS